MHRFFVPTDFINDAEMVLPAELVHQICRVLRMRPGQHIVLFDDTGWEYEVELNQVEPGSVTGGLVAKHPVASEPSIAITLYQSLMKRDRFELVLQKCTEVGVTRFVPVVTQRSIVQRPASISDRKMARWGRIIIEAAEQSGRGRIPQLGRALTFQEAINGLDDSQLALIPWERETQTALRTTLPSLGVKSVSLFIGPEGGFAAEEIQYGQAHGAIPLTLGPRVLRSETAAVVSVALILYQLGEMA